MEQLISLMCFTQEQLVMRQNCKFLYLISKTKCLYERIRNTGAGISGQVKLEGRSSELMRS
ncbi:MAG: hypothetical protein ACJ705_06210 [Nitrososphaeraceae archaeon]